MSIRKKWIGDDQIDGSKIRLLNNQSLTSNNALGSEVELFKLDGDNKLQMLVAPQVSSDPTAANELARKAYVDAAVAGATITIAQTRFVTTTGNDSTGDGSLAKPFATISAALAAITDASPTKRYAIKVSAGNYTESAGLQLKPNVFVIGDDTRLTRITGAVSLHSSFSGSSDHRSGFSNVVLVSAVDLNWATVTSAAGKIYCRGVIFNSTVSLYGHNNASAQAGFDQCQFFGVLTISGINVGTYVDNFHFANLVLNQHPNGGMATIVNALGCRFANITATAAVNDFGRRISIFAAGCFIENLTLDGPATYADLSNDSTPKTALNKLNGGNVVYTNKVSPGGVQPDDNNSRYIGDFGKQWFFNFAYVHASTGTDLYLTSAASSFGPDSAGRSIFINPDGYGLNANVNGGNIVLETAAVSGTGVKGKVDLKARQLDMNDVKIVELADGVDAKDAVNKSQLDVVAGAAAAAQDDVDALDLRVGAAEDAIEVLNGDASVVGSVDKKVADAISSVVGAAPEAFDTLKEIADWIAADETGTAAIVSQLGDHETRISDLETDVAGLLAASESHERIVLDATMIANGYVDLAATPKAGAVPKVLVYPDRLWLVPTDDFSRVGARITWNTATVGPGGEEALVVGDIIHVWYAV